MSFKTTNQIGQPGQSKKFNPEKMLSLGYRIFDISRTETGNWAATGRGLYLVSSNGSGNAAIYAKGSSSDYPWSYGTLFWEHITSTITAKFDGQNAGGERRARARQEVAGTDAQVNKATKTYNTPWTPDGDCAGGNPKIVTASLGYRLFEVRLTAFTGYSISQYCESAKTVAETGACGYSMFLRSRIYIKPIYINDVRDNLQTNITVKEIT